MIDMRDFGYTAQFQPSREEWLPARIIQAQRGAYRILSPYGQQPGMLKGALLQEGARSGNLPAVGDFVGIRYQPGQSVIQEILPRKAQFSRPDYSGHAAGYVKTILEQVVAANFDYVFILCSLNHDLSLERIQRYLVAAWNSGGMPVVVLTKADLRQEYSEALGQVQDISAAAPVVALSAKTGEGMEQLSPYLERGKTIVFLGSSGVGKSSLVNRLAGEEIMRVKEIREDDSKGRHTTTHRQLIPLPGGAMVIDTPGMREISLWDAGQGMSGVFADVESLFARCRFTNCRHDSEPGCAVKAALASGELSPRHWERYRKLQEEALFTQDKAAFLRAKEQWHQSIAKWNRQYQKKGGKRFDSGER